MSTGDSVSGSEIVKQKFERKMELSDYQRNHERTPENLADLLLCSASLSALSILRSICELQAGLVLGRFLTNPRLRHHCKRSIPPHGRAFSALFAQPPPLHAFVAFISASRYGIFRPFCSTPAAPRLRSFQFRLMVEHFPPFSSYPHRKKRVATTFSAFFAIS